MSRQPESLIKSAIMKWLSLKGIYAWINKSQGTWDPTRKIFRKSNSPWEIKGVSDILGILPNGQLLAIEVKTQKSYPTPEQKRFLSEINSRGGLAFIARSIDDCEKNMPDFRGTV